MEPVKENEQPPITVFCRACGKGLTAAEAQNHLGTVYCSEHMPKVTQGEYSSTPNPYTAAPVQNPSVSPGLAFVLGLIPGVGAIYNGQYAKGFVHVLIAGLIFSLSGRESGAMRPLFELFIPVFFFYMAFEAFHTAKKRMLGETVDEFSSIFPNSGGDMGSPALPVFLIALGVLFLLDNLHVLSLRQLVPYAGPMLLIGLGCYMLYARVRSNSRPVREVSHERN